MQQEVRIFLESILEKRPLKYKGRRPDNHLLWLSERRFNYIYMSLIKLKRCFLFVLAALLLVSFFTLPVKAQEKDPYGLDDSAQKVGAFKTQIGGSSDFLNTKIGSIIEIVLSFIGVIFLLLMIYAGINWMTSSGNEEKVKKSKELITNAIIGLIIVLAAYAITAFIGENLIR